MRNLRPKSPILFPVNVSIIQKSTDGQLVDKFECKNMVLKQYGLYSYVRWMIGDFYNNNLIDQGQYIPKYLAVGSNEAPSNGAPGVGTTVKITDTSLYHELNDGVVSEENQRIKLNRASYIEDVEDQPYLKVQYEAYIPEDRFVNANIGEFGLMTGKTGFNAFARISNLPTIKKIPNTVIQIIWEITIISVESSTRFVPPIKKYLREAIEKAINVLQVDKEDPDGLDGARKALDELIEPATNVGTGLSLLLNDNEQITQDVINNYLSKPFKSVEDTGLIALINRFPSGEGWLPTGIVIDDKDWDDLQEIFCHIVELD